MSLESLKFKITNLEECRDIQSILFKMGYEWASGGKTVQYCTSARALFANESAWGGAITYGAQVDDDSFHEYGGRECVLRSGHLYDRGSGFRVSGDDMMIDESKRYWKNQYFRLTGKEVSNNKEMNYTIDYVDYLESQLNEFNDALEQEE